MVAEGELSSLYISLCCMWCELKCIYLVIAGRSVCARAWQSRGSVQYKYAAAALEDEKDKQVKHNKELW